MSKKRLWLRVSLCAGLLLGCGGSITPDVLTDCDGVVDGEAFEDACGTCVGGGTGLTACVEDCNGDPGGEAFEDACGTCVGGGTGMTACVEDCNGDLRGEAFEDACGACVGGATGLEPCVEDCNGDAGGTAVLDGCGNCLGGKTDVASCMESCGSMVGAGSRYISLTTFDWDWPGYFEVQETDESIFGRVKRVNWTLYWLHGRAQVAFPPGRWMIDTRVSSYSDMLWELGAAPESEDCASVSWISWRPTGAELRLWQVPSEKLFLEVSQACSVELILKSTDDHVIKLDSRLDWIRIRYACSVDADCPALAGSPNAMCVSEVCIYDNACFEQV